MPILPLNFPFLFEICCISFLCLQSNLGNLKKKIHLLSNSFCSQGVQAWFKECNQGIGRAPFLSRAPGPFPSSCDRWQNSVPSGSKTKVSFSCWLSASIYSELLETPAHGPLMPLSQHGSLLLQTQPRNLLLQNKMQSHIVYCNHRSDCLIIFATLC